MMMEKIIIINTLVEFFQYHISRKCFDSVPNCFMRANKRKDGRTTYSERYQKVISAIKFAAKFPSRLFRRGMKMTIFWGGGEGGASAPSGTWPPHSRGF
jgi:hypothetical protein